MLSSAWTAVAAMPTPAAIASFKMMCATRIASSSNVSVRPCSRAMRPAPKISAFWECPSPARFAAPALLVTDIALLIREWPHPQLLLSDLPQPRKAARLDREEKDNEGPDDHELKVLDGRGANRHTD